MLWRAVAVVFALAMVWKGIDYLTMSSEECAAIAHYERFDSECLSESELRAAGGDAGELESPDTRGWLALGTGIILILIVGASVVADVNRSDELARGRRVGDEPRPSVLDS